MEDLRSLIRDMLSEELARIRLGLHAVTPHVTEEMVTIRSSADLNAFAQKLLTTAKDGRACANIIEGHHRFRLSHEGPAPIMAHQPMAPPMLLPQLTFLAARSQNAISPPCPRARAVSGRQRPSDSPLWHATKCAVGTLKLKGYKHDPRQGHGPGLVQQTY
jgi:hypothetical protein